jgi:KAP family P-loop domain
VQIPAESDKYRYVCSNLSKLSKKYFKKILRRTPYNLGTYQFAKDAQLQAKILTDEIELETTNPDEEFSFEDYSNAIVSIVNGSQQKFCVGIYGEWGTGKTTLMRLVERKLRPHVFYWDNVRAEDSHKLSDDGQELMNFLRENFKGFDWIDNGKLEFKKTNENKALTISDISSSNYLSIILDENDNKAKLELNDEGVYNFSVVKQKDDNENEKLSIRRNNVLTVWFNAWRYEREEQFALVPLMKTIAFAMGEHAFYKNLKPILLKGLELLSKDVIRNLATRYVMTESGVKEFEQKIIPKLQRLPEIDKDTIYFDGLKTLENEIKKILKGYQKSRIVVFIDDLDRCSPDTTLEVFESIKAFLDIEGFVFIIGLSREALDKLITKKFEQMGLSGITGEEYIRKIIQIEINIQKWKDYAIKDLIGKLSYKLQDKDIEDNKDLIAKGIEMNPRQVKRLINRYVVARSANLSAKRPFNSKKFLVGEIFNGRWPKFYQRLSDETFLTNLKDYIEMQPNERNQFIQTLETKKGKEEKLFDFEEIVLSYKDDSALWDFIEFNKDSFFMSVTDAKVKIVEPASSAKEWKRIQRASDSTNIPISSEQQLYPELMRSYEQFRMGFISTYEFWEEGKLRHALHNLLVNSDKLYIHDSERWEITNILDKIEEKVRELKGSKDNLHGREVSLELSFLYSKAIDLISKFHRSYSSPSY